MDESADFQPSALLDSHQSPPLFDTVDINGGRRTNGDDNGLLTNDQDNEIFESAVQVSLDESHTLGVENTLNSEKSVTRLQLIALEKISLYNCFMS